MYRNRPGNRPIWPPRSEPNRNRFVNVPSVLPSIWNTATNVLTNGLIFPSDPRRASTTTVRTTTTTTTTTTTPKPIITTTTTPKPTRTTTANSFWQEWSLPMQPVQTTLPTKTTRPTKTPNTIELPHESNINHVQTTTPAMADWMKEVISAHSTTSTTEPMLPWMEEILNEHSTTKKSNNQLVIQTSTMKPTKTTTINSFWGEWSATNPTNNEVDSDFSNGSNLNQSFNEKLRQTTTEMPGWMRELLNEHSTTSSANNGNNQSTKTTTARAQTATNMPSWMRDVLNEHSTTTSTVRSTLATSTTKKSSIGDGILFFGDGGGDGNDDLHVSTQNRYSL